MRPATPVGLLKPVPLISYLDYHWHKKTAMTPPAWGLLSGFGVVLSTPDASQGQEQPLFPEPDTGSGTRNSVSSSQTPSQTVGHGAFRPDAGTKGSIRHSQSAKTLENRVVVPILNIHILQIQCVTQKSVEPEGCRS